MDDQKVIVIAGAGPGGLTAAYELLKSKGYKVIVYESSTFMGGIARTINYKGNRIDIGGHRFFSKSDKVMRWWQEIMPMQKGKGKQFVVSYQGKSAKVTATKRIDPDKADLVMLVRPRLSRIYYLGQFFDYPLSLNVTTLRKLGLVRTIKIFFSYVKARIVPIKKEKSLEDFFINRFGKELYLTFFKEYTEKVWGVSCKKIKPEWGAQRIKGVSLTKAVLDAVKRPFRSNKSIEQKNIETSLIQQFLYPKYGPGQMWEEVAKRVTQKGGEIHTEHEVVGITIRDKKVTSVKVKNTRTGDIIEQKADYFISTMAIRDLIDSVDGKVPPKVKKVASGLLYRDFITVGLLVQKLKDDQKLPDTWIYVQEPGVNVGRIQIFNNWSPYLVKQKDTTWLGLEFFCNEGDKLWKMPEQKMKELAIKEMEKINLVNEEDVLDSVVIHMKKTYPAYFGSYDQFEIIRDWANEIDNMYLIGRNGMHRYNNQDHSMLTAMLAAEQIITGSDDKAAIWSINTEQEYHEEKK